MLFAGLLVRWFSPRFGWSQGERLSARTAIPSLPTVGNGHHYMHTTQLSLSQSVALAPTMTDYPPHNH